MECCFFGGGGDVRFRYENETPTTQRGQMRPHKAEAREGPRLYLLHLASFRHLLRFAAEACMTSCLKDALYLFTVALKHVGISSYGWNTYASEQVPPWVLLSLEAAYDATSYAQEELYLIYLMCHKAAQFRADGLGFPKGPRTQIRGF